MTEQRQNLTRRGAGLFERLLIVDDEPYFRQALFRRPSAKVLAIALLVCLATVSHRAEAGPSAAAARARTTVTVRPITEWSTGGLSSVKLIPEAPGGNVLMGSTSLMLLTNADVEIEARHVDDDPPAPKDGEALRTEYRLEYDGDGVTATGGPAVNWTEADSFLSVGSRCTHVRRDGNVKITLWVKVSRESGNVGDDVPYSATQRLFATPVGEALPYARQPDSGTQSSNQRSRKLDIKIVAPFSEGEKSAKLRQAQDGRSADPRHQPPPQHPSQACVRSGEHSSFLPARGRWGTSLAAWRMGSQPSPWIHWLNARSTTAATVIARATMPASNDQARILLTMAADEDIPN